MIQVGKKYLFKHSAIDDVHDYQVVTITSIADDKIAQLVFGDTVYRCVTENGVEGIAFAEELVEEVESGS